MICTGKCDTLSPGALGGTLNGDPCSLLGIIWVAPCDLGVYEAYIRVLEGNGIKGPF